MSPVLWVLVRINSSSYCMTSTSRAAYVRVVIDTVCEVVGKRCYKLLSFVFMYHICILIIISDVIFSSYEIPMYYRRYYYVHTQHYVFNPCYTYGTLRCPR